MDPRGWDLNKLLAAFEAQLRQSAKDEAAWRRTDATLRAEPKAVRDERRRAAAKGSEGSSRVGMTVDEAEALLARFAAADSLYA